ncbi:MAG: septum site-determining protein MinD [Clostridia bacterium]
MARRILITSGKGGVGKTTLTASLGKALAVSGKLTLVIDMDFGLNNLDIALGLEGKIIYDIGDVLSKRVRCKQALVQSDVNENLFLLSSAVFDSSPEEYVSSFSEIIRENDKVFDYILLDCPAGMGVGFQVSAFLSDEVIVVVTPHLPSIRDASKVVSCLHSSKNPENIMIVVNRLRPELVLDKEMISAEEIEKMMLTKLIGVIVESDEIAKEIPLEFKENHETEIEKMFICIAHNLITSTYKSYDYLKKYKGVLGLIRKVIKKKA